MQPSASTIRRVARRERNRSENVNSISVSSPSAFTVVDDKTDELVDDDKTWSCEDDYKYPLKDSLVDPWEQCYDIVDEFDEELIRGLKDEIGNLLVVASLFLAIVTAFVIESAKWLKPDSSDASADLLSQVVQLLNQTNTTVQPLPPSESFTPNINVVTINQLWFLSMIQSLAAVVLGTLCLQWLSAFTRRSRAKTHDNALALRQMRYEGLIGWGVPRVPAILLLNVQAALVLFAIGLLWWLWYTNKDVAFPVAIVAGVTIFLLVMTTLMPLLQSTAAWIYPRSLSIPQCPFKSPISFIIHRFVILLALCGSHLIEWFVGSTLRNRIRSWRNEQKPLLTDTVWEYYDELWRKKREDKGPQAYTEENDARYSHYLAHGLASVMSALIAKPSAVHIIHNCLQDIHGSKAQAKTFKKLFRINFSRDEEELLATAAIRGEDMFTFRKDFLSAHVLQYFVNHNDKLHRTVLKHRVELFIRVNNTANQHKVEVGKTITCPITSHQDAASISMAMRRQVLDCIKNILSNRHMCSDELRAVRFVMKSIDLHAKVTAKFIATVQDFAEALMSWQAARGDVTEYRQTMQVIAMRFPQVSQYPEVKYDLRESTMDFGRDSISKVEREHIHTDDALDAGEGGTPESYPLMKVDNKKWQGGRG